MLPNKRIYNLIIKREKKENLNLKTLKGNIPHNLPLTVDLRNKMPPVYDQGELGSCTANALCAAFSYDINNRFQPSRLFVYYNERLLEHTIHDDAGALLSDGIRTLVKYGVCSETLWPYDISKFTRTPKSACYKEALKHKATSVTNIRQTITEMKKSLYLGFPFVVGIAVYSSFENEETAKTGLVPLPNTTNEELLGGHAVLVCGYNEAKRKWICRNSWGESWGDKGYFYLDYDYLLNEDLSSDLWNITQVVDLKSIKSVKEKTVEEKIASLEDELNLLNHKFSKVCSKLLEENVPEPEHFSRDNIVRVKEDITFLHDNVDKVIEKIF